MALPHTPQTPPARQAPLAGTLAAQPAASLADWARLINGFAASAAPAQPGGGRAQLLRADALLAGSAPIAVAGPRKAAKEAINARAGTDVSYRMAPEVAEHLVADGLDPDFLNDLATASGLEPREVLDFAGIDRTTVSRRKASGAALPQDAAVKALQATDLMTQATEVFGSPAVASAWLTKPHPSLEGQTPLRRARTPWGMSKVQGMLVALRHGGVA